MRRFTVDELMWSVFYSTRGLFIRQGDMGKNW